MTDKSDRRDATDTVEHDTVEHDTVGADADEALDHALRERPVDEELDSFDDDADDPQYADDESDEGESAPEAEGDDGEEYVLYSDVRPHLEALVQLQDERVKMVELLLYARDRVSSPAVATRMDDNLAQLGITVIVPEVGDQFDAAQHEASATVHTDDADKQGTIAEIELAGYADGEQLIRHPIVTVYTTDKAAAS